MNKVLRIAHRGASGYAPENTLPAFQKAIELDSDMVELDVRRTRDGILVVFHDARLNRLTNGRGLLKKITFEELKDFHVHGYKIPTLDDCLQYLKGKCEINIEIKERGLAESIAHCIKRHNVEDRTLVSSFLHSELLCLKAIDPRFRVAVVLTSLPVSKKSFLKFIQSLQPEAIHIAHDALKNKYIMVAKQLGLKIHVWTVDEPADIFRLKVLGVDGIFSNYPDRI